MKVYNILYILIILTVLCTIQVNAETSIQAVKQGRCVQLPQAEFNSTYQVITYIQLPDNRLVNISTNMTKNGDFYNYTFCNTKQFGKYIVNGKSDLSTWAYSFNVGNIWIPIIIGILAILFLALGIANANEYLGLFSAFLWIILGVYSLSYGLLFLADTYTQMVSYVIIGIGVIIGFASVYEMYEGGESKSDDE